jgi:hypothetical protein
MITGLFEEQGIRRTKEWGCTGAIAFTETKAHVSAVLAAAAPVIFINPPGTLMGAKSPLSHHCCVIRDHGAVAARPPIFFGPARRELRLCRRRENMPGLSTAPKVLSSVLPAGFSCEIYPDWPKTSAGFRFGNKRLRVCCKAAKTGVRMAARDQGLRSWRCAWRGHLGREIARLGPAMTRSGARRPRRPVSIELDGRTRLRSAKLLDGRMRLPEAAAAACGVARQAA